MVVIESGVVTDEGSEEQVARPGGPYDRLWRVQADEDAAERDRQFSAGAIAASTGTAWSRRDSR